MQIAKWKMRKPPFWTTPIENRLMADDALKVYHPSYKRLCITMYSMDLNTVRFMKLLFGRQSYTTVGEFRYWVWVGDDYIVYASNKKGLCFEIRGTLPSEEALEVWIRFEASARRRIKEVLNA